MIEVCRVFQPGCQLYCILFLLLSVAGCSSPWKRFADKAGQLGYQYKTVQGVDFTHAVFSKQKTDRSPVLHVYLDGDGSPWIDKRWVASDPTPRNPLVLRLMKLDTAHSIYLGRPCYHGFSQTIHCASRFWTHERYSQSVVTSMVAALNTILHQSTINNLVLIGYSGGGTLAMLIAEQIPQTSVVVTIAANLAVQSWVQLHGYSSLTGSLDPFFRPPLDPQIVQLHLAGAQDKNVPPFLIQKTVERQSNAKFSIYDSFDHNCCWEKHWPEILEGIQVFENESSKVKGIIDE